jgi:hypothetical protein
MIRGQAACAQLDLSVSNAHTALQRKNKGATRLSWLTVFPLLLAATFSGACGDDGETPAATPTDAGTTPKDGGGGPMVIPRRDAQVSETPDPITPCQRADANACPAGEVCDLLLRLFPGDMQYTLYTGCLKAERERGEGDPCNPDPTTGQPYQLEGLTDPLYRDICGPGLVCAPNRKVRGAFSCQTSCSSGAIGDQPFPCEDATALCASSQASLGEFCRKTDGCNIEKQTGCLGGEGCYLVPSDDQKQLLAFCSPEPAMPDNDGQPCRSLVTCKPGSVCLGPVNQPISAWSDTNLLCRPACNGQSGQAPANDEDAGVPSGLCSATTRCAAFAESGLLLSSIPTPPFGQCESQ